MLLTSSSPKTETVQAALAISYHGLIMSAESLEKHKISMIKMLSGYKGSSLDRKIGGSDYKRFTIREGLKHRVVFAAIKGEEIAPQLKGGTYLVHIDDIRFHNYRDCHFFDDHHLRDYLQRYANILPELVITREKLTMWLSKQLNLPGVDNLLQEHEGEWQPMMRYRNKWLALTNPQVAFLDEVLKAQLPLVLSGPGGAGKTIIQLGVLSDYINRLPLNDNQQPPVRILFVTKRPELAKDVERRFQELGLNCEEKGVSVEFLSYKAFILKLQENDDVHKNWKHAKKSTFREWFKEFDKRHQKSIQENALQKKKNQYKAKSPAIIDAIFEELQWTAYSQRHPGLKFGEKSSLSIESVNSDYLRLILTKYQDFLQSNRLIQCELFSIQTPHPVYDLLLLDEAQGFTPIQFDNLCLLGKNYQIKRQKNSQPLQMLVTGDTLQRNCILSVRTLMIDALQRQCNRTDIHRQLTRSIRCSDAVLQVVNNLLSFFIPYVTQGLSDEYEYSQIKGGSGIEGSAYFLYGDKAVTQCNEILASLDDKTRLIVLARPQDIPKAVELFGTENVVPVSKYSGLERDYVVAFNLLSDPVYTEIDKIAQRALQDESVKTSIHRPKDGKGRREFAPAGGNLINAFLRAQQTLIIVQNTPIHPVRHLAQILEKGRKQPVVERNTEVILSVDERRKKWEDLVVEFVEHDLIDRAKAVYKEELEKDLGDWDTYYQNHFNHFQPAPPPPPSSTKLVVSTKNRKETIQPPPLKQETLIALESLNVAKWQDLFKSPQAVYKIIFQSPYKSYGSAFNYLVDDNNFAINKSFFAAIMQNPDFCDALFKLLFNYYKEGNETVFIREVQHKVTLSIEAILQSQGALSFFGSRTVGIALLELWLLKGKINFREFFIRAIANEESCLILTRLLEKFKKLHYKFSQIKLTEKFGEHKSIFEHLLTGKKRSDLLLELLKKNSDEFKNGLSIAFLSEVRANQQNLIDQLIKDINYHSIINQIMDNSLSNSKSFLSRQIGAYLTEAVLHHEKVELITSLLESEEGARLFTWVGSVEPTIVNSLPPGVWFKSVNNCEMIRHFVKSPRHETFLHTVMMFYAQNNTKQLFELLQNTKVDTFNKVFVEMGDNFKILVKLHQCLSEKEKLEFENFLVALWVTTFSPNAYKNPNNKDKIFDFLITNNPVLLLGRECNKMPILHLLVFFDLQSLINKLTLVSEVELVFSLKDKSGRTALDLIFSLNRPKLLDHLLKRRVFQALVKKFLGDSALELLLLWQDFSAQRCEAYLSNPAQCKAFMSSAIFYGKPLLFISLTNADRRDIILSLTNKPAIGKLLADGLHEQISKKGEGEPFLTKLAQHHQEHAMQFYLTVANIGHQYNKPIDNKLFSRVDLFGLAFFDYCQSLMNNAEKVEGLCDLLISYYDNNFLRNFLYFYGKRIYPVFKSVFNNETLNQTEVRILQLLVFFPEFHELFHDLLFSTNPLVEVDKLIPDYLARPYATRDKTAVTIFSGLIHSYHGCTIVMKLVKKRPEMAKCITADILRRLETSDFFSNFGLLSNRNEGHLVLAELQSANPECFNSFETLDLFDSPTADESDRPVYSSFNRLLNTTMGQVFILYLFEHSKVLSVINGSILFEKLSFSNTMNVLDFLCCDSTKTQLILYKLITAKKMLCKSIGWNQLKNSVMHNKNYHNPLISLISDCHGGIGILQFIIQHNHTLAQSLTWEQLSTPLFRGENSPAFSFVQWLMVYDYSPDYEESINFLEFLLSKCPLLKSSEALSTLQQQKLIAADCDREVSSSLMDGLMLSEKGKKFIQMLPGGVDFVESTHIDRKPFV